MECGSRGAGRGRRAAGNNAGAISDGNARHVGMRRTPPAPLLIRERFVVFFIDDFNNAVAEPRQDKRRLTPDKN